LRTFSRVSPSSPPTSLDGRPSLAHQRDIHPRTDARLGEVVGQAVEVDELSAVEVDELSEDQRRRSRYGQAFRPYQIRKPMVNRRLMSKLDKEIFNCYLSGLTLVIGLLYC
jgi:hypothetical protein